MLVPLLVAPAGAATLTVGPSETYSTINAALSAAADGDTIRVRPGTYSEALDLRGRDIVLTSTNGPAQTRLAMTSILYIDDGLLEGFTISTTTNPAVYVPNGAPTLRELHIVSPPYEGVSIAGGNPLVEEVGVWDSGSIAFKVSGGSPILQRSMSYSAATYGFDFKSATTVRNLVSIRDAWGFVFENETMSASHLTAVGATVGAVGARWTVNVSNSIFLDNVVALKCFLSAAPAFTTSVAWNTDTVQACPGTPFAGVQELDAQFASWAAALPFEQLDLRLTGGSPAKDAGTGTDADGSVADLGAFGGAENDWRDRDGDGYVVLFDCDDRSADSYPYAPELADDLDNDCDGVVDEGAPVDTGGGDSGGGDTATDTATDDTGTDTDTDTPSTTDLDGDGALASVDCDEHNRATFPGAPERMDGADNDCDGGIDEGTPIADDDGDSYSEIAGDCDDTRPERHPGADDSVQDGLDHDCDGKPDNAVGQDFDGDDHSDNVDDCDDTDPLVNPGRPDPLNGVDDDCDGLADDDWLNTDADADGQTPAQGDCDDEDRTIYFGAPDTPDDFVDQDCNGTDNYDADRDGDPAPASGGTDCDDSRSTVYAGAPELCGDNLDNDCDGSYEEDCGADDGTPGADTPCGCGTGAPGSALVLLLGAAGALTRRRDPRVRGQA
jgi:hypothetical protein